MAVVMSGVLSEMGFDVAPNGILELIRRFDSKYEALLWEHYPVFWRELLRGTAETPHLLPADDIFHAYLDYYSTTVRLYDDVVPFLEAESRRAKLAFVANGNSQRLERLLRSAGIGDCFDVLFLSSETPHQKPDRFAFEYALDTLGVAAEHALVVGDRFETDIVGGLRVGIACVHVSREDRTATPPSCGLAIAAEVGSLAELSSVLDSMRFQGAATASVSVSESSHGDVTTAVVLCGGKGRRMGTLCESVQKCMLMLSDRPILDYTLRLLVSAGVKDAILCVGHCAEGVQAWVGDGSRYGLSVKYVNGVPGSTLKTVLAALKETDGRSFVYAHGNVLFSSVDVRRAIDLHTDTGLSVLAAVDDDRAIRHARFVRSAQALEIDCSQSHMAGQLFAGLAVYDRILFEAAGVEEIAGMTERVAQLWVQSGGMVEILPLRDWYHFEDSEDYLSASECFASQVLFGEG
jgi:HAD superfamily hydrolase (TIGR01549 family)